MLYASDAGEVRIALTGDALITRQMSVFSEPRYLELVDLLRDADAAITNAEMLFHDYENAPTVAPGGTYMRAHPRILHELQWLGINMIAAANNHSYDYGENGLLTNIRNLEQSGMAYAGIGLTMARAREPRYLDTPGGRVALIALTSSGPTNLYAGHQWRDGIGRPGANMLRYTSTYHVPEDVFTALRSFRKGLALGDPNLLQRIGGHRNHSWGASREDTDSEFYLGSLQNTWQYPVPDGCRIALSDTYGVTMAAEPSDVAENLQRIDDARRMADWVVVSMHSHEQGNVRSDPARFVVDFAHAAIDAGAHIFHGHGPHIDRGIEIYKGRPIFYSLGHFVHENATVERMALDNMRRQGLDPWEATPADFADTRWGREWQGEVTAHAANPAMWRDVVAMTHFGKHGLDKVVLHPIDLGFGRSRGQRGRPVLAGPAESTEVLTLFRELSKPFGTEIAIEEGLGVIRAT